MTMAATEGTHFYFIAAFGPGRRPAEMSGSVTPSPIATRQGIYQELRNKLCAEIGCDPVDLTVTSFAFEPNAIGV